MTKGFKATEDHPNALVTFGIVPTFGHTGLGYVHRGEIAADDRQAGRRLPGAGVQGEARQAHGRPVRRESGRYYWNSGMFVWRADTVLAELAAHLPDSYAGLAEIAAAWGTPQQSEGRRRGLRGLKKISVDYAIMEPASQGKGQGPGGRGRNARPLAGRRQLDQPCRDAGDRRAQQRRRLRRPALLVDSDDNIILSTAPGHLISTIGVSDMIIVHTPDATMICPKSESQRVKDLVGKAKDKFGGKLPVGEH